MIELLLVFGAGLVVGWNVLPQPKWVQALWSKAAASWTDPG